MVDVKDLIERLRELAQARHDQEHLCYADGGIESDTPLEEYYEWIAAEARAETAERQRDEMKERAAKYLLERADAEDRRSKQYVSTCKHYKARESAHVARVLRSDATAIRALKPGT